MTRTKLVTLLVVAIMLLVAAAGSTSAQDEPLKIVLVVNGVVNDASFFASANRGMDMLLDEGYNVDINVIELGIEPEGWESGLADAMANQEYDVLIAGTGQMVSYLAARVHLYPDKYFIFFDDSMPYDDPEVCVDGCTNVYSVLYSQNQGSFMVGVYAAAITTSDLEGINPDVIIGAVGGQDIPVINDFIVGYEQGACLVNSDVQVLVQYAGDWNDPATGKEIALAQYDQKADIIFQVAGGTGQGVFEAALEDGKYAIGVDSDQASQYLDTDPDMAQRILTSMMKNVDNSLFRAVDLHIKGELPYGEAEVLGIAEGGVGVAYNDIFFDSTPDNILDLIDAVEVAVDEGKISIVSAFGDDPYSVGTACSDMPEVDFDASMYLGGM